MKKTGRTRSRKLALFDIDGTLIMSGGAGKRAMITAFEEIFGVVNAFELIPMSGRTDPEIVRHALATHAIDCEQSRMDAFKERYIQLIAAEITIPAENKRMLPGIPKLLKTMKEIPHITLGLLTGNWRQSALIKLAYFDLARYFEVGAFADDSEIRDELLPYALERYYVMAGVQLPPKNVFIIGDTPRDVQCARPYGAKSVAVATGWHTLERLAGEKPDYLFKDLTDFDAFLKIFDAHG